MAPSPRLVFGSFFILLVVSAFIVALWGSPARPKPTERSWLGTPWPTAQSNVNPGPPKVRPSSSTADSHTSSTAAATLPPLPSDLPFSTEESVELANAVVDGLTPIFDVRGGDWSVLPTGSKRKKYCVTMLTSPRLDSAGVDHGALADTVRDVIAEFRDRWADGVLFIYNTQSTWRDYDRMWDVAREHRDLVEDGKLIFGRPPYPYGELWPQLADPSRLYGPGESTERIIWRSKTVLDYLHGLHICEQMGEMILAVDDDVIPAHDLLRKIERWFDAHANLHLQDWFVLNLFYTQWTQDAVTVVPPCCNQAYLIQASDVPLIDQTLRSLFDMQPLDLLFTHMARTSYPKKMYVVAPNLFQHRQVLSSLEENGVRTALISPTFKLD